MNHLTFNKVYLHIKTFKQKQCGPPPDPIYNYLRDPERDGERTLESKQVRPQREYRPFKNNVIKLKTRKTSEMTKIFLV